MTKILRLTMPLLLVLLELTCNIITKNWTTLIDRYVEKLSSTVDEIPEGQNPISTKVACECKFRGRAGLLMIDGRGMWPLDLG